MNKEYFYMVKDPRVLGKVEHQLEDVLRLALFSVICCCEEYAEMKEFTENRLDELKSKGLVSVECGVPSKDTFRRVLESINPDQLHRCLIAYGHDILDELAEKQIVIDGKKLRGTSPSLTSSDKGLYTLNVWVAENEICIRQHVVHDKTNEITVIPQALAALDITDAVVSIDAMGTQRKIAGLIKALDGHYFMALKENQGNLLREVEDAFKLHNPTDTFMSEENGHGREEKRECSILPVKILEQEDTYEPWPGLKTIVRIVRHRTIKGVTSKETAYYISDEENLGARYFNEIARAHWGIENKLHWCLDVIFREDESRIRSGFAPQNMAILRKLALAIMRRGKDKRSLKMRRKKCLMNLDYLSELLKAR